LALPWELAKLCLLGGMGKSTAKGGYGAAGPKTAKVIPFYSDKEGREFREFSNFYRLAQPYEFQLPTFAKQEGFPSSIWCSFSEKAIMATKAAIMGDGEIFREIDASDDPKTCKSLGRGVRNFHEQLWQQHLEEVAFEVVRQKFESDANLKQKLLSTGDHIIAEAAPNDAVWGIGLPLSDPRCKDPEQWCGRNVLGFALMRAREVLRNSTAITGVVDEGRRRRWGKKDAQQCQGTIKESVATTRSPPLFDSYVVLDFEATCNEPARIEPQEIIELPLVIVDASTGSVRSEFRTYVQPLHHPKLTSFCTELTGIKQSMVSDAPAWGEAFRLAQAWLDEQLTGEDGQVASCLFVTCGDWDLQSMLLRQCKLSGDHVPQRFKKWLNIKNLFRSATGMQGGGMKSMLEALGLELIGRHHSGLDDCRNIARILAELISRGAEVTPELMSVAQ